ncbi:MULTISPECIES: hypothetical protein [unclassified Streptomyces]|uniref:hypothetical protein n=1 Tax=unclassified Streptomyces TaxID=2593676 RepID=UPI0006AF7A2A|nr:MULTISPECIES: hypothetical protein [unclassified Streptomyces]KOX37469.1 hypothetical protein ADL06_02855 [Streptomyces sp. NRRL F-6491]KOX52055.1 hypothetical protein ADL08_02795 [Streptomyces sp. NRRL F-6492]
MEDVRNAARSKRIGEARTGRVRTCRPALVGLEGEPGRPERAGRAADEERDPEYGEYNIVRGED